METKGKKKFKGRASFCTGVLARDWSVFFEEPGSTEGFVKELGLT